MATALGQLSSDLTVQLKPNMQAALNTRDIK